MHYQSMEKSKRHSAVHANIYFDEADNVKVSTMAKVVSILGYITIIGWLVAIVVYGRNKSDFASFHLRQSLGLIITGALLALIPLIGWLLNIAVCFAWFYSFFHVAAFFKAVVA